MLLVISAVIALVIALSRKEESPVRQRREPGLSSEGRRQPKRVPKQAEAPGAPIYSQLEDIILGSISGRLIDTEGNAMEGTAFQGLYEVVGQGLERVIHFQADGSYEVKELPPGTYFIRPTLGAWPGQIRAGAQHYWPHKEPENIYPGMTGADIMVMSGNPGAVRGKVLAARTTLPVQRFTVYHKYDYASAEDRARRSDLFGLLKDASSGVPDLDEHRGRRDSYRDRLESLGPEADANTINDLMQGIATLEAILNEHRLEIVSERGLFEQAGYFLGNHLFTVLAEGYLPKSVEVELRDAKPVEVTFLMHEEGATVAGRVEDGSGNPVKGASVEILVPTKTEYFYCRGADPKWERLRFVTEESGGFAFGDLPDGRYEVKASQTDYRTAVTSSVRLLDGHQEPANLVLKMSQGEGRVWGQVTGPDGEPLAGVALKISGGASFADCTTDKEGYFAFRGLPPGKCAITIDQADLKDRDYHLSLAPSEELRHDIVLSGSATLMGRIFTGGGGCGNLDVALRVTLRSAALTDRKQWHFTPTGFYRFKLLPPGDYELEAFSDSLGIETYAVSLKHNETRRLDINLARYGNLKGKIIGRDGEPLAGVRVVVQSTGKEESTLSNVGGRYSVADLSPGRVVLEVPEGEFAGTWYELKLLPLRDEELDIDFSLMGDIKGQIFKADRAPFGRCVLKIESSHRSVELVADREGRFQARGLFPGRCSVHLALGSSRRAYPFELVPQEEKELEIILPP